MLQDLSEDVFTCEVRISSYVEKYNRVWKSSNVIMSKKRIFEAWMIYIIHERIKVQFEMKRKESRNIDIEAICSELYPLLRESVDQKWLRHKCEKCKTRLVVLDGNCKAYRTVCRARGEKIISTGRLNEFTCCVASPLPSKEYCSVHLNDGTGSTIERLDTGVVTRSMRKELGLDIDELTSGSGMFDNKLLC